MLHGATIGDRVSVVRKGYKGTVRYVGPGPGGSSIVIGVALDEACGQHNGTVHGREYFQCKARHGILVAPRELTRAPQINPHARGSTQAHRHVDESLFGTRPRRRAAHDEHVQSWRKNATVRADRGILEHGRAFVTAEFATRVSGRTILAHEDPDGSDSHGVTRVVSDHEPLRTRAGRKESPAVLFADARYMNKPGQATTQHTRGQMPTAARTSVRHVMPRTTFTHAAGASTSQHHQSLSTTHAYDRSSRRLCHAYDHCEIVEPIPSERWCAVSDSSPIPSDLRMPPRHMRSYDWCGDPPTPTGTHHVTTTIPSSKMTSKKREREFLHHVGMVRKDRRGPHANPPVEIQRHSRPLSHSIVPAPIAPSLLDL